MHPAAAAAAARTALRAAARARARFVRRLRTLALCLALFATSEPPRTADAASFSLPGHPTHSPGQQIVFRKSGTMVDTLSFLHVIRPEIDLPEGTNSYDDSVYAMAEANFERFRQDGTLVQDTEPHLYLYRQVLEHRQQIGLVCCCHIDDYANDVIKKHEKTREDKEDDRTRHLLTLNAHTGPVFLTYRGQPEINELIELARLWGQIEDEDQDEPEPASYRDDGPWGAQSGGRGPWD